MHGENTNYFYCNKDRQSKQGCKIHIVGPNAITKNDVCSLNEAIHMTENGVIVSTSYE